MEDSKGNIWFGTWDSGLGCYTPAAADGTGESYTVFSQKEGLSHNTIWSILEDREGDIWIGTDGGGVSRYSPSLDDVSNGTITHFTQKEGLINDIILSIYEDSEGHLWFGTNGGGICRFNTRSANGMKGDFTNYTEEHGLSNNTVWAMMEDQNNNLWVSTEYGLNQFEFEGGIGNKKLNASIHSFNKEDGLRGVDFYANCVSIDRNNRMWWGSGKGLEWADMDDFVISYQPPTLQFNYLEINEHFIDFRNLPDSLGVEIEFDSVQQFSNFPLNPEFSYRKNNHFRFHFSAVDWSAPHKIKYSYILEGLDNNWSKANKEAKADYRNIPPGSYTFKVCAIGASGEWSVPYEYRFIIHSPWWSSWMASSSYVLIGFFLVAGLIRRQTNTLKRRQKELENEVGMATVDLIRKNQEIENQKEELRMTLISKDEKEILLKEIHHRVKNNLQIINSMIRLQSTFMDENNFQEKLIETENRIRSMGLIHEMLYKSHDLASVNVKDYISELKVYIRGASANYNEINFNFEIEEKELGIDSLIPLGLIINEILSNSLKYAFPNGEKGNIGLKLFNLNNRTFLSIWNDGVGSNKTVQELQEKSLGIDLIFSLTDQLDGKLSLTTKTGFRYEFVFPRLV